MVSQRKFTNIVLVLIVSVVLSYAANLGAANNINELVKFNVDEHFEINEKSEVAAVLVKTTPSFYFYVEKSWWDSQVLAKQNEILTNLSNLSYEFDSKIYPILTSTFGQEWKPGVDGDNKITVLFHLMKENIAGYFRSTDEYLKIQLPTSNEREMIYLPIAKIDSSQLKVSLAHEFVHLITFNQKDRLQGVQEEVWLNEARADYASTILGYDNIYESSNLQKRVKDFLERPSDSLTEWQETKYDYASVNVFFHYLTDHYGVNILTDPLKSKLTGIASINDILLEKGYKEDFHQIFTKWTIALIINECSLDIRYCYLNQNLKNLRINSTLNFLPLSGDSSLSVTNVTKNWSGSWQKIIGGSGDLTLEFSSLAGLNFKVPYLLFDKENRYSIKFLELDKDQKGKIEIKNFDSNYNSLVLIPSLQTKTSGFDGFEFTYPYTFKVSITGPAPQEDQVLIQKLLAQIEDLKKQISALQTKNPLPGSGQAPSSGRVNNDCKQISSNLYLGVLNKNEVSCLQTFLESQGTDVYPEGLITGNFGNLTRSAVIRFQEKYKTEILNPIGLNNGTGFVGILTRVKINQLLTKL